MTVSTISSKGQVVIPKSIRTIYDLKPNSKVIFEIKENAIVMKPLVQRFNNLKKRLSDFQVDPNFRKDWEKSLTAKLKQWQ